MFETWREFRVRQRARLGAREDDTTDPTPPRTGDADAGTRPAGEDVVAEIEQTGEVATDVVGAPRPTRFGTPGQPLNRRSPFYMGFVGAIGVVIAVGLWHLLGNLRTIMTIVLVATFLALALDPIVGWLTRRGLGRGPSVAIVSLGLLGIIAVLAFVVVPPVVSQAVSLVQAAPDYVQKLMNSPWVQKLNDEYGALDSLEKELKKHATDSSVIGGLFGGILGAGKAVVGGVFQVFTITVVTLYLLSSLPKVKGAMYALVPMSRRPRFTSLSEEILRRVGAYALGQVAVASVNGVLSFVMMTIVGIPYAAILAVVVGLLGLIPMVGATLGAVIVCIVAAFTDITYAVIAAVYYIAYQQFENYVVAPRVMQRTVSVPGLVTVIAAMIGGALMGVLGALIAIPVAAGIILIYQEVVVPRQNAN